MNALAKKLLIKPNTNWLFYNAPPGYLSLLEPLPDDTHAHFDAAGSFDGIQFFVKNSAELGEQLKVIGPLVKDDTVVWVCYPKKSSGIATDLEMMRHWEQLTPYGIEIVAAAAIDTTWTALRIRKIGLAKKSGICVDEIRDNEYGQYIDVDKRLITLPPDVQEALQAAPAAMLNYDKLSYTNRKEYVMWILTAKQQKTRDDRLLKMVEKLLAGKKNPSEK